MCGLNISQDCLANRVKRLEDSTFPLMPTIVMLQDGETLEDAMLRKEIPDMKDGYPTFVIAVSFV